MSGIAAHGYRPKGSGSIHYVRTRWLARGPLVDGKQTTLGRFDTYREAKKALEAFLAKKEVA